MTQEPKQQPKHNIGSGSKPRTAPIIFLRSFMLSGPSWFMMPGIISLTSAHGRSEHKRDCAACFQHVRITEQVHIFW